MVLDDTDRRLVAGVARTVGVPRLDVPKAHTSFVLHAPLELMARAALLPMVHPSAGEPARQHLVELRERYATIGEAGRALATAASAHHDAHRVKYTLACLHAADQDPGGRRLYLAAAAYLNAWWEAADAR